MTKQEKIGEEIASRYYYAAHPLGNWNDTTFKNKVIARNNADEILSYLHDNDVVIKVDRELPTDNQSNWEFFIAQVYPEIFNGSLDEATYFRKEREIKKMVEPAFKHLLKTGYVELI